MLNDLAEVAFAIHTNSKDKGFWDYPHDDRTTVYLSKLALVHSEVSEVLEAIRKEKGDVEVVEEIGDTIIRLLDLWAAMVRDGYTNLSLSNSISTKMTKNMLRPKMHGVLA